MGNPYTSPIARGCLSVIIPKNPKVEQPINTMVVHVRERGTLTFQTSLDLSDTGPLTHKRLVGLLD